MMPLRTTATEAVQISPYLVSWLVMCNSFKDATQSQAAPAPMDQHTYLRSIIDDFPTPCYLKTFHSSTPALYSNVLFQTVFGVNPVGNDAAAEEVVAQQEQGFKQVMLSLNELESQAISTKQDVTQKTLPAFLNLSGKLVILQANMTVIQNQQGEMTGIFCRLTDLSQDMSSKTLLSMYMSEYRSKRAAIQHFLQHIHFSDALLNPRDSISKRELDCLIKLSEGKTAKETARDLYISHRTVETHIENLKYKLGVKKKHELLSLFKSYFK